MARAATVILLHSHMPYVRRNGDWPVGEEWLLEAWAESYIPLWGIIEDLTTGALTGRLCLTMTPVLAEQLQDAYMEERLDWYLKNKLRHSMHEKERLQDMGDDPRRRLASFFGDEYRGLLDRFERSLRGRMIKVLAEAMDAGVVEVLASAATHAHLPSLGSDTHVRAQIEIGLESYRRCFGRDPHGFWLPECSYTPGLDNALSGFSPPLSYVVLDFTALKERNAAARTWEPHRLGGTPLVALLRDRTAHELVWTMHGYPSGGDYREFAKRDYEGQGFQYWRVTSGDTPLDAKDVYDPGRAEERARADAEDFAARLRRRREELAEPASGRRGTALLLAAYDTELMGHWWREGPSWLREVLRLLGEETELACRAADGALGEDTPVISPGMTAWNTDGTFSSWVNPGTVELWEQTHRAEVDLERLARTANADTAMYERAAAQAARELLLMESSDWTFMISRDAAAAYARDRFEAHRARFRVLADMLERGEVNAHTLADLEETDNPFPWLTISHWL